MPFAEHRGGIALPAQERWQRQPAWFDEARAVAIEHAFLQRGAPRIAARQQGVARWRADPGGRMRVSEHHAFARQPIEMGRAPDALGIETGHITDAHVIREDVENVRPRCGGRANQQRRNEPGAEEKPTG
jgi:hypothetical protein